MSKPVDGYASNGPTYRVSAEELRQIIEYYEHLDARKKDLSDEQKEVMGQAKARGYDTKILKMIIALRKKDPEDVAEQEAILQLYRDALGV